MSFFMKSIVIAMNGGAIITDALDLIGRAISVIGWLGGSLLVGCAFNDYSSLWMTVVLVIILYLVKYMILPY